MTRWIRFGVPAVIFAILFVAGVAGATWMGSQFENHDARTTADFLLGVVAGVFAYMGAAVTWSFLND